MWKRLDKQYLKAWLCTAKEGLKFYRSHLFQTILFLPVHAASACIVNKIRIGVCISQRIR